MHDTVSTEKPTEPHSLKGRVLVCELFLNKAVWKKPSVLLPSPCPLLAAESEDGIQPEALKTRFWSKTPGWGPGEGHPVCAWLGGRRAGLLPGLTPASPGALETKRGAVCDLPGTHRRLELGPVCSPAAPASETGTEHGSSPWVYGRPGTRARGAPSSPAAASSW